MTSADPRTTMVRCLDDIASRAGGIDRRRMRDRSVLAPALALVAGAALAAPAGAQSGRYSIRTIAEPAKPGLAVTGALSDLVATSNARVLIPAGWRPRSASAGQLRFQTTQNASCRYNVRYTVSSVLAPAGDAGDYAAERLPAASSRYLLDSGERGNRAFRVVRQRSSGGGVRVEALWAGVLTRRSDVAANGQIAWTEIRVSAVARSGDECHAGTWRESLGPTIGDSLAVARTKLRFSKKR
jgi:hypothetical protein